MISSGLGSINVFTHGAPAYSEASGNGANVSPCLPVFQDFCDVTHYKPPSCHGLNLLIFQVEPMMMRFRFKCTRGNAGYQGWSINVRIRVDN